MIAEKSHMSNMFTATCVVEEKKTKKKHIFCFVSQSRNYVLYIAIIIYIALNGIMGYIILTGHVNIRTILKEKL